MTRPRTYLSVDLDFFVDPPDFYNIFGELVPFTVPDHHLLLPHISLGKTFLKFLRFVFRVPIENHPTGVERKYELFEICFLFLRPSDNSRLLILNDTYLNLLCFFDCNPHLGMSFGWLSFADWIYFNIWKSCIFITRKR